MMQKYLIISLILLVSCNPYQPHESTHFNVHADIDPRSGLFDVNLQLVYLSPSDHYDSLVFRLDKAFTIHSLSAQELIRYEFSGDLVLYIQDPVLAGDRLHVSMSYSGKTEFQFSPGMDHLDIASAREWLPFRDDMEALSYRLNITLPEGFLVENCTEFGKPEKTCILESQEAGPPPGFRILRGVE